MGLKPLRRPRGETERSEAEAVRPVPREASPSIDASRKPAAVSEALWAAVPEPLRTEILSAVARDIVRCIHPEKSVERQLMDRGLPTRVELKRSPIVVALHRAFGGKGAPGAAAEAAEARVLDAIRKDPVTAWSDPGRLCVASRVPAEALNGIADLVRWEAERAMNDLRARQAAGDPSAEWWVDPEAWAIEHEEGFARGSGPSR